MTVGERLKSLRESNGFTQVYVAKHIGATKQTVYKYETGIVTNIPLDKLELLADLYGVTPAYITGWNDEGDLRSRTVRTIPLVGVVACGIPLYDETNETVVVPENVRNADFALRCKGESMINAGIYDGDIVYIRKQDMVDEGQIAAVSIDGEATLKKVYYKRAQNMIMLVAENPAVDPLVYYGEELDHIRILGKAVGFAHSIEAQ